ncbi:hypothetical protein GO988_02025 [Hymenobacter sp. HMF4947]|uniref:Uncharacterized protein n=1 Tax=Hymenobacter ginkgonis TaxID=2682976 RepID=A0A7K1T9L1_9BACT|nr:hypothetical protein [Hymenobacter ginkgonis]MVN75096.1 hypothetical protein [Hymenobacter ginkgonis]
MKTYPTMSADRLQLISQILGIGRGEYLGAPATPPRRARPTTSAAARKAVPPITAATKQRTTK